jgi:hypothetical protein
MAFDTVVFGSYIKGTGFTDGASIETGGLRCFIKPTANIGNAPFDTTITYYDQFGVGPKTTLVSTSVAANTPSGAHIEIILNAGDTGIRDLGLARRRTNLIITSNPGMKESVNSMNPLIKIIPEYPVAILTHGKIENHSDMFHS